MHADAALHPDLARSSSVAPPAARSSAAKWTARVITALAALFFAFDLGIKLLALQPAIQGTTELGFAASLVRPIGVIELACLVLYLVPRTAPLGAILFTGYLGGAIATHVRLGNPLFTHQLSPIYFAAMLWLPLYLRDARVRALVASK
jgi:hypothetical protein